MIRRLLIGLAGGRYDLLEKTPTDRFRYTATGGVLLTTAAVAAMSAAFALTSAVRVNVAVAVVLGIAWGVVILNLDRLLLVSMTKSGGFWRSALTALPRIALALLLGAVISTPLVLRIFHSEIDAELKVLAVARTQQFEDDLANNPRYAAIPGLESQLFAKEATANSSPDAVAETDPAVVRARTQVATTKSTYEEAQRQAQCEIDGTCGTGIPGVAEAAEERRAARDIALTNFEEAKAELTRTLATATSAARSSADTARAEAGRLADDLANRRADRDAEQAAFSATVREDTGLLSQIEALDSVGERRGDLWVAQYLLFLLFMSLELLPILVKLMQVAGPPTLYDELLDEMNASAKRIAAKESNREETVVDEYSEYQTQLELDQARRQYEAGREANALLVNEQAAIAERAIRRWAQEAAARSDHDIDTFFGGADNTSYAALGRDPR